MQVQYLNKISILLLTLKENIMNAKMIHLALAPFTALMLGLSVNVAHADDFDIIYPDDDLSIVLIGEEHVQPSLDLASFELRELDNELVYPDDDLSIVLTGAR